MGVRRTGIFVSAAVATAMIASSGMTAGPPSPDFERDVAPILINRCLKCHHAGKASGGLNLAVADGLRRGGESGPPIMRGKPAASLLWQRIAAGEMPPQEKGDRRPLSEAETHALRDWIASGANWPQNRELGLHEQAVQLDAARAFWSFQPVRRPPVPRSSEAEGTSHPIDAFVDEELVAKGLQRAGPAARLQLLRRASLDLIGLPPTLAEQDLFLADGSPGADERLIDRLLADPGYGERWARHWLDLVRYADSNGYERDGDKPSVWRYRDYVIDSLNADKPYDRFVLEQLAGDELSDRTAETAIATGFHALGTWQDEVDPLERPQYRADELDDMLRTTSQTFLGLTIGCARCHNHKFDPLSMVDYYSMSAILAPLKRPNLGRTDRDLPVGSREETAAVEARDRRIAELNQACDALRTKAENDWLASGRSRLPAEAIEAFRTPISSRRPQQAQLAKRHASAWQAEIAAAMSENCRLDIAKNELAVQRLRQETPDLPRAYVQYEDAGTPAPTYLLLSGRASNPGPVVQPAVPAVLARQQPKFAALDGGSSGRRLALARWIVAPENPLTARVIVNRVWQHHFGEGLVATPSDFGHAGARPTHPELLDWLSHWFVHDAQWSLKKLHRLVMTSRTYQTQSSGAANELQREVDPDKLLAKFPCRRLDVETIRDSILAASGKLNREMHGPAVYLPIPSAVIEAHADKEKAWQVSAEPAIYRRTIYAYVKRTLLVPMLESFDFCDTVNSTERRNVTSIAPQSLTLYNGEFVNRQAAFFAERLAREAGDDPERQIERAVRLTLCRPPTPAEAAQLRACFDAESREQAGESADGRRAALIQICRVLLNLNEFVYAE